MRNNKSLQPIHLIILCALIFAVGIAGSIYVLTRTSGDMVEIVQDGEVIYTIDLSAAEDQTIEVEYEGGVNIIEINDHRIRVLSADCPDQICVDMGWLNSAVPVTCLPNHLMIRYVDSEDATGLDAVSG